MKRRSRTGGDAPKTRGRKTPMLKRRNAPNEMARRSSSLARAEAEVARLTRELSEALKQRTTVSEELRLIRGSQARAEAEAARLTRELSEVLQQQKMTSEVLRLMSSSHRDLARLFDTILANATRLCQADFGLLSLCEGNAYRVVAIHNASPAFVEPLRRDPLMRSRGMLRMAVTKQRIHLADITKFLASELSDV